MKRTWFIILSVLALALLAIQFSGCSEEPGTPAPAPTMSNPPSEALGGSVQYDKMAGGHDPSDRARSRAPGALDNDIALSQTVYGTDFTVAGVGGLRLQTSGNITLAGISGSVTYALLYWSGPTNSEDPTENSAVTVNGNAVVGTNIGFSNDNCWAYLNSQAYVADVTAIVQATGNGVYALTDFGSANSDNNGASLIVFFSDGDNTNNRDVVLFHGNDSNMPNSYDADGWNVSLSGINYTTGTANLQLHVGDGQEWLDDALTLNGDPTFVPGPNVFDGNTVPSDNNGPTGNGNLWDIRTWDVTSYLVPGPNTLTLTTGANEDCLGLIVVLIDLPAGAAPVDSIVVELDLHPNSCPNPINIRGQGRGVTPVAILGTADFDVTTIDASTILLNGVAPLRWGYSDVATPDPSDAPVCQCNSDGADGYVDLTLKFNTGELVATLGDVHPGDIVELIISGATTDGTPLGGTDCMIVHGGNPHGSN